MFEGNRPENNGRDWKFCKSSKLAVITPFHKAKTECYATQMERQRDKPNKRYNNYSFTSPEVVAKYFNKYFTNVGPRLAESIDSNGSSFSCYLTDVKLLHSLTVSKATGLEKNFRLGS